MCGILALFKTKTLSLQELNCINESFVMLKNRGPDQSSFVQQEKELLCFTRLAIVGIDEKNKQPFLGENSSLMCNGEIFNHKQLENSYGLNCITESDCECVLHLHSQIGFQNTIESLNGDFAIVLRDNNIVYFGRDRIGVRPLFYGFTNNGNFAVSSYARALTNFCDNVIQVKPGWGTFNITTQKLEFNEYITLTNNLNLNQLHLTRLINTELINSVKLRLMSDRKIGCLLSGGLDSSLVASILCRLVGSENVRTYSIGMENSLDLGYAKQVAEYLNTDHTEVYFTPQEGLSVIPDVIKDLESYDITTIRASIPMWLLARYISNNTQDVVLFSGEGADELFCGYLYFHYAPNTDELSKESLRLIKELYKYDVLRADRCISSHGLELRVPFLDPSFIDLVLSLPDQVRKPTQNFEKYILRKSFENYLPENVLWRRKDGFSDGCSNPTKSWYEYITEFVDTQIKDSDYNNQLFPSKEAMYYKQIYNTFFPKYQPVYEYWLPKWVDHKGNPSGRITNIFNE